MDVIDIEEKVDEFDEECERPLESRLLKLVVVGALSFGAKLLIEAAYDAVRDREKALPEAEESPELSVVHQTTDAD